MWTEPGCGSGGGPKSLLLAPTDPGVRMNTGLEGPQQTWSGSSLAFLTQAPKMGWGGVQAGPLEAFGIPSQALMLLFRRGPGCDAPCRVRGGSGCAGCCWQWSARRGGRGGSRRGGGGSTCAVCRGSGARGSRRGNGGRDGPLRRETLGSRRLGKACRAESHASGAGDAGARTGTRTCPLRRARRGRGRSTSSSQYPTSS